jgi:hypothetical protein
MIRTSFRRSSIFFVFCFLFAMSAAAAPTQVRILVDSDASAGTGCRVITNLGNIDGIDAVVNTTFDTDADGNLAVTGVTRQTCATPGTVNLTAPETINNGGWPVGHDNQGNLFLETSVPASAIPGGIRPEMKWAFVAASGAALDTVLQTNDHHYILYPGSGSSTRRRVVGAMGARTITLDGNKGDWEGMAPIVSGIDSTGGAAFRFIGGIQAYATDSSVYFAFSAQANRNAPTANEDGWVVLRGKPFHVNAPGVLVNDFDPNHQPLTAVLISGPQHGTLTLNSDGSFSYQNDGSHSPNDSFRYKANNGTADSNTAQVSFDVVDNRPPSAQDDIFQAVHGGTVSIPTPGVLQNDSDPDNDPLRPEVVNPPSHGSVTMNDDGSFTYTHDGTNTTTDAFTYHDFDPYFTSNLATVAINIGPDAAPVAAADSYGLLEGATLTISQPGLFTNDTDADTPQGLWSAVIVTPPVHGTLTMLGHGSFKYVNDGLTGISDSFQYKVNDTIKDSNIVTVTLNVTPVNDAPSFALSAFTPVLDTAGAQTVPNFATGISAGASDESGQALNFIVTNDNNAIFSVQPSISPSGTLTYTPVAGAGGVANLNVLLHDNGGTTNGGQDTSAPQSMTAHVDKIPSITSANTTTFAVGAPGSFTVTTNGLPQPSITETGALPAGVTFVDGTGVNKGTGVLSGTPAPGTGGSYPITFQATNPHGSSPIQNFTLIVDQGPAITSANNATFTRGVNGTFTVTTTGFPPPALSETGTVPAGLTFTDNGNGTATLAGTPTAVGGVYSITVTAANGVGANAQQTLGITINEAPAITSANATGFVAGTPGTFTVTTTGFPPPSLGETGSLPAGITFIDNGNGTATLGGTAAPGSGGVYPITITATNLAGSAPQSFNITVCNVIAVGAPGVSSAVAGSPFSQNFTQTGAVGGATFTLNSGTLPAGMALATNGTLSGTPTQTGSFPITVKVTDGNGCTGISGTYTLVVSCQTITVTNPATSNGTAGSPFSQTFTQSGAIGGATFTLASGTLPAGMTLATNGTLSGTPTQTGSFPITVTVTDGNGCTGTSGTYTLVIGCQTITVTNPATTTGTAAAAFSQTFTQSGAIGSATFTTSSTLPAGLTLATDGTLSGTPTQTGSFPIAVTVTDGNGCTGTGATYTLVIGCQVITVTNPATTSGTAAAPFSETFTQSGGIGATTFSTASALPAGLTLASNGTLSGTPTQTGTFNIVVTATDSNGCTGSGATYTLIINCQTLTVTNPVNSNGIVNAAVSEQFTESGSIGGATFTTGSTLPTGITLSTSGLLSGTTTQTGSFPIVVTVTDGNGCTGTGGTYTLVISCQTITVSNPATSTGVAGSPFSQTFTQTGAFGGTSFTTGSTLPAGLTLAINGTLSGTPTQTGSFPIVVTVTDANGCTGTGGTYTLVISCQTINVTNPATTTGTAGSAFSQTFTQTGAIGGATFTLASGTLPAGLTLSSAGLLSGTPTQTGSFPITVTVTDGNGCTGTSSTYTLVINCQTITVTNPATTSGVAGSPFSQTFTQSSAIGGATFTTSSTLPAGLTLSAGGVLSGTPTQTGSFPIVVTATDGNGCTGTGATYTLVIACQTITVSNPGTTTGTVNAAFSQTFTQSGAIGGASFSTASTLPAGLTLSTAGVLSGTPTQTGSFPIVVTVTDGNGCTGSGATYTLVIGCQTITVTNPGTTTGTVNSPFSQTFTQTGGFGTTTFSTVSTLPAGLTLASNGTLSGTPTQVGSFPITVTATDSNGCTGTGAAYTLVISCQTITVTNPALTSSPAGTPFSQSFTQTGAFGSATFTTASTLPTGLTLSTAGVLSGTPSGSGTFPIVVTVTDANGCTGTGATYNLTITCPVITVTNPATSTGTAGTAFSQTFTQSGGQGGVTFTLASGTLPAGLTLSSAGLLSGTPTQTGSFPITVTVTDGNGCTGTGSTYTLVINCQTITVTNPATTTGTAGTAFSQSFTQTGAIGGASFSLNSGSLPAGLTLSAGGLLSGTPTQTGSFPITVKVTDGNGCTGISATYTLVIGCQTITVTNPATSTGTIQVAFSQTFTQTGAIGSATFSLNSGSLPAGLTLSSAGVLSGTPTVTGSFPITVKVTDGNGCTGVTSTYTLVINCQTITVTNPAVTTGVAGTPFSQLFTQTGGNGTTNFSTASTLPAGITLAANGTLSGTPTQTGSFPITVTATDANGCTGTGATYTLVINCQTITVTNPGVTTATVGTAFSQSFTQTGAIGGATFTTGSTLPTGLTLSSAGLLAGTPTQPGTFPITVTVTDGNGCTGTGGTYTLVVACQTINVTNPATTTGTVDAAFSQTFTQTGALGGATFTLASGSLPAGLTLSTAGVLSGTPGAPGSFPITVKVTDGNGCTGTSSTYTLVIACQTITVTTPATTTGTVDAPFSQSFAQTGVGTHTPAVFTTSSTLPPGLTLSSAGLLSGTPGAPGTFPITVTVTDANGCTGASSTYTLVIACQTITVTNPGVTQGTFNAAFSQTFTQSGVGTHTPGVFSLASGTLPSGITLSSGGVLSGTPTQTGTFSITVKVTDVNGCSGTGGTYLLAIGPNLQAQTYNNAVGNTQYYITGVAGAPATPAVTSATTLLNGALPAGSVTITAANCSVGGTLTFFDATGKFIFTPAVAATSATCTYTATSDTGGTGTPAATTANLTFSMVGRVWYVNVAAGAGDGRSNTPFNNTSSLTAGVGGAGDVLYIYDNAGVTTNTKSKITLLSGQSLTGEGVALVVNSITLRAAGTKPVLTNTTGAPGSRDVVALATSGSGNVIQGVTLSNTQDSLVIGTSNSGLTIYSSTLTQTAGNAVNLTTPAGITTIANNTFNISGSANGLVFATPAGTLNIGDGTLGGNTLTGTSSGDMLKITNGTAVTNVLNSPITQTTGRAVNITGKTGGNTTFTSSNVTVSAGTTDGAVTLSSNSGSETFAFNKLTLSTTGTGGSSVARALVISSSGTVNNSDTTSTLSTTDSSGTGCGSGNCGAAIDASSSALSLTFQSINVNGTNGRIPTGMFLSATTGSFTINGTGSTAGTGGTVQKCTAKGADIRNATNVTLKNMNFTNNATANLGTATVCGDIVSGSNNGPTNCNANISISGGSSNTNLTNVSATGSKQIGIDGNTVSNLTLNGVTVTGNGNEVGEDGVQLYNPSGTLTVNGSSVFTDNGASQFEVGMSTGTLSAPISASTFSITNYPGACAGVGPSPGNCTANAGLYFHANAGSTASMNPTVTGCTFSKMYSYALRWDAANGGTTGTVKFGQSGAGNGNTFTNNGLGINIGHTGSGNVNYEIVNNILTNDTTVTTTFSTVPISTSFASGGTRIGLVDNNRVGVSGGAVASGCFVGNCNGIELTDSGATGTHQLTVTNNQVYHVNGGGIVITSSGNSTDTMRAKVTNNTINSPDGNATAGILVQDGNTAGFGVSLTCLDVSTNTVSGLWASSTSHKSAIRILASNAIQFSLTNFNTGTEYAAGAVTAGCTTQCTGTVGQNGNAADFLSQQNPATITAQTASGGSSASQNKVAASAAWTGAAGACP